MQVRASEGREYDVRSMGESSWYSVCAWAARAEERWRRREPPGHWAKETAGQRSRGKKGRQ